MFEHLTFHKILKLSFKETQNILGHVIETLVIHDFMVILTMQSEGSKYMKHKLTLWQEILPRSSTPKSSLCLISELLTTAIHFSICLLSWKDETFYRDCFAPQFFGKSVNPIPTGKGRLSPPITIGTPNLFHLPASLFCVLCCLSLQL